jgi:hypothetical protein
MYRSVCFACAVKSGARVEQGAWSGDVRAAGAIVRGGGGEAAVGASGPAPLCCIEPDQWVRGLGGTRGVVGTGLLRLLQLAALRRQLVRHGCRALRLLRLGVAPRLLQLRTRVRKVPRGGLARLLRAQHSAPSQTICDGAARLGVAGAMVAKLGLQDGSNTC